MLLLLAALLALGGLPVTDDILARLERLESRAVAIEAQQRAMGTEMIRRRGAPDAMTERDVAALLSPRGLTAALGSRTAIDRTPDLATPLMARLRDDAALSAYASGRVDTLDGYANVLSDPTLDTLGASPTGVFATIGTGYTEVGPGWEAKYVLNSGTAATTRSMGRFSARGDAAGHGYGVGSSGLGEMVFLFGTAASDMTIYLRPTDTYSWEQPLPSWLVASMRLWLLDLGGASTPNVPATAYLEIVDGTDAAVATGDSVDLMELMALAEFGSVTAALEAPEAHSGSSASYRPRLRVDLVKAAGATARTYILIAEPLLSGSDDGSAPAFTPAVGSWLPGAPGRQLVLRTYAEANVVAGATTTMSVTASGFPVRVPEVYGGSIVGVGYRWGKAITGGSHSIIVQKNGSNVWTAFSGASAQGDAVTQPPFAVTFDALDTLTVDVVTGGGFLPSGTNDIVVDLYLLLDYGAS